MFHHNRSIRIISFLVYIVLCPCSAQLEIERGLSFTRSINEIPGSFDLLFDGHQCNAKDEHGDNDCHFEWGSDVTGGYKLYIDRAIDVGDSMTGHFKVRNDAFRCSSYYTVPTGSAGCFMFHGIL